MASTLTLAFVFLAVKDVSAFFPNNYKLLLHEDDYTCADITQIGVLQAVARYFEENPQNGHKAFSGNLTSIPNLTPRLLYDRYYGEFALKSTRHIQEALSTFIKANNMADLNHNDNPEWTFNAEKIDEANVRLIFLRQQIIKFLQHSPPNYDVSRNLIGQALYMIQQFYSNTNWVEMYGDTVNHDLGVRPLMPVAGQNQDTCRGCQPQNCSSNILVNNVLTSGYRSGQTIHKPAKNPGDDTGKCSHGGEYDASSYTNAAVGGINKDSSSPELSPHHYLHETAARAAIKHTELFFSDPNYGLRSIIGDDIFEDLLQLQTSNSLVFVIDTTQSMTSEINTIRSKTIDLVSRSVEMSSKPYKYILVEFKDSEKQYRARITKDSEVMICWLSKLTTSNGGDCPDFSMTGIQKGAEVADPNSNMYVFTDSNPKDSGKLSYVESIIKMKRIKVDFIITGQCSASSSQSALAQKRSTNQLTEFHRIARVSGGEVFDWSESSMKNLLSDVIEESIKPKVLNVLKTTMSSSMKALTIDVDMMMTAINILVRSNQKYIRPILYRPDGTMENFDDMEKTTFRDVSTSEVYLRINKPVDGAWKLVKLDDSSWNIDVTSESLLLWDIHLLQSGNINITEYDIRGNPIVGENVPVVFEINDQLDAIGSIDEFQYLNENGISMYNAHYPLNANGTGRFKKYFRAELSIPSKPFYIKLLGRDKHDNKIQYQNPQLIIPSEIKLDIFKVTGTLSKSTPVSLWMEISNVGPHSLLPVNLNTDNDLQTQLQIFDLAKGNPFQQLITILNHGEYNPMAVVSVNPTTDITGGQYEVLWLSVDRNATMEIHRRALPITTTRSIPLRTTTGGRNTPMRTTTLPQAVPPTQSALYIDEMKIESECIEHDSEGSLSVRHGGTWGKLVYNSKDGKNSFGNNEATVVCRTLGYSFGLQTRVSTRRGTVNTWYLPFTCDGTETNVNSCKQLKFSQTSTQTNNVGVSCYGRAVDLSKYKGTVCSSYNDASNCADYGSTVCTDPSYGQWVITNCPVYCGLCSPTTASITASTTTTTTPQPTISVHDTCQDLPEVNCSKYQNEKAICDVQSVYRKWAELSCRLTCGLCAGNLPPFNIPSSGNTNITSPTNGTDCADSPDTDCRLYEKSRICPSDSLYNAWTIKNCRHYCGYCTTDEPDRPCVNKLTNCDEYQKNMCTDGFFRIFAETNCRKFCKLC